MGYDMDDGPRQVKAGSEGVIYEWQGTAGTAMDPAAIEAITQRFDIGGKAIEISRWWWPREEESYVWLAGRA
jgi:hypothetical protein